MRGDYIREPGECAGCGADTARKTVIRCRPCCIAAPVSAAQRANMSIAASRRYGKTPERDARIRALAAPGLHARAIGAIVGVSHSTVGVILRHGGWSERARGERL